MNVPTDATAYATLCVRGISYRFRLDAAIDISLPITEAGAANGFSLPPAQFETFVAGSFVGSVEQGGPVRCDVVTFAPHGNGTHTECVGHIAGVKYLLTDALRQQIYTARLVTVDASQGVIGKEALSQAWQQWGEQALIIRTLPNSADKRTRQWSGTNPPYVDPDAMQLVVDRGVDHFLIDVPSVDPESDGGAMKAHRMFWQYPDAPRTHATITEFVYASNDVPDGVYVLSLNAAAFRADAAPSRPTIYPIDAIEPLA